MVKKEKLYLLDAGEEESLEEVLGDSAFQEKPLVMDRWGSVQQSEVVNIGQMLREGRAPLGRGAWSAHSSQSAPFHG